MYITCSVCYHLYVSIGTMCACDECVCMFAVFIYMQCNVISCLLHVYMYIVWVLHSFIIFIITKSLSVLYCFSYCYYYYLLIVSSFIPREAKNTDFSASKPRPSRMRSSQAHLEAGPVIYSY